MTVQITPASNEIVVSFGRQPINLLIGEDTAAASAAASSAAAAAASAEAAAGPTYADTATGLAATADGKGFAVDNGDGTVTIYLNDGGVAVAQRTLATTAYFAATDGADKIGTIQIGAGAVARTLQDKVRDVINVHDWGIVGDGSTDNTAAMTSLRAYAALRSFAGNAVKIVWPQGRYVFSNSPNWAINRLHMSFDGEVWLISTGAGSYAMNLDGGASGSGVYEMRFTGYPQLHAPTGGSHALYWRAVHRSHLEMNFKGAGASSSFVFGQWCVSNTCYFLMNANSGGFSATPARGMTLTQRDSNEDCSYNTFINPEASGLALGAHLDAALGNMFIGGAFQGCTTGVELTANAWENKFLGTDFEVNTLDVKDAARRTNYIGCDMEVGVDIEAPATGTRLVGGRIESINIESGVKGALLDTSYNRVGSGTVTDGGTKTAYEGLYNISTEEYEGPAKTNTELLPTTGDWVWQNTSAHPVTILVAGGTVGYIAIAHAGSYVTGQTSGAFVIVPGSSIVVNSSVAPTVRLLTGGRY